MLKSFSDFAMSFLDMVTYLCWREGCQCPSCREKDEWIALLLYPVLLPSLLFRYLVSYPHKNTWRGRQDNGDPYFIEAPFWNHVATGLLICGYVLAVATSFLHILVPLFVFRIIIRMMSEGVIAEEDECLDDFFDDEKRPPIL